MLDLRGDDDHANDDDDPLAVVGSVNCFGGVAVDGVRLDLATEDRESCDFDVTTPPEDRRFVNGTATSSAPSSSCSSTEIDGVLKRREAKLEDLEVDEDRIPGQKERRRGTVCDVPGFCKHNKLLVNKLLSKYVINY